MAVTVSRLSVKLTEPSTLTTQPGGVCCCYYHKLSNYTKTYSANIYFAITVDTVAGRFISTKRYSVDFRACITPLSYAIMRAHIYSHAHTHMHTYNAQYWLQHKHLCHKIFGYTKCQTFKQSAETADQLAVVVLSVNITKLIK